MNLLRLGVILFFLGILGTVAFAATPEITQVSYDPSPAVPGTTITILVQLENKDNIVQKDVAVSIDDLYPFTVVEEKEKNLGDIQNYGKALVQFKVYVDPSAENQGYPLTFNIKTKNDPNGVGSPFTIIVSGNQPSLAVVSTSTERLIPGQEKEVLLTIQNIGTSPAYGITIELQEDRTITATGTVVERDIVPIGAATKYIDKVLPGETASATIKLSVNRNATLKNYTLPVSISYRDSSGARTTDTSYIGFKVAGNVEFDATVKEATLPFIAGTTSEVIIELFNKGEGKSDFTIAQISTDFGVVEKPKQFIGTLEPNDVDTIKTKIQVNSDTTTGQKDIVLEITYQDTDATNKKITLNVPVQAYSVADGAALTPANPIGIIALIVIILVIIYVGRKIYKKRTKK